MEILENNKTVLVKGNVIGFEKSTLEPPKYLVQFPDLTTASLSVDMIEDELQKPVIPQSVSDWIEKCKTVKAFAVSLAFALHPSVWEVNGLSNETIEWLMDAENQDLFARSWLDGYKIEKEKRYLVKMKNIQKSYNYLNYSKDKKMWVFSTKENLDFSKSYHTRKELEEAGFGEVFNNPLFEVEEVE